MGCYKEGALQRLAGQVRKCGVRVAGGLMAFFDTDWMCFGTLAAVWC
jgi:hypothetical protein